MWEHIASCMDDETETWLPNVYATVLDWNLIEFRYWKFVSEINVFANYGKRE